MLAISHVLFASSLCLNVILTMTRIFFAHCFIPGILNNAWYIVGYNKCLLLDVVEIMECFLKTSRWLKFRMMEMGSCFCISVYSPAGKLPRGTSGVGAVQPEAGGPEFQNFPWILLPVGSSCSFVFSSVTEDFASNRAKKKWRRRERAGAMCIVHLGELPGEPVGVSHL